MFRIGSLHTEATTRALRSASMAFNADACVYLCGLTVRTELNGKAVTLVQVDKISDRWCVRTADGAVLAVKATNLEFVSDGAQVCFKPAACAK